MSTPDLIEHFFLIRSGFQSLGLEPPSAILLSSHQEGMEFLSRLNLSKHYWNHVLPVQNPNFPNGKVVEMADGSARMQMTVLGINVSWPANRTTTADGTWFS